MLPVLRALVALPLPVSGAILAQTLPVLVAFLARPIGELEELCAAVLFNDERTSDKKLSCCLIFADIVGKNSEYKR
jgi:hypothetical protein